MTDLMYDIRQFKPALYALLLLGISGFALAGHLLAIWLVALFFILLNAWLEAAGRLRPISRRTANVVTIACVLFIGRELFRNVNPPVVVIGEFLVLLQIVKLWEQRGNRDYGQLLILSLLLMVAASMNTASLWFGVLLTGYLFLSLYCCLLFHLKVETDSARSAMPLPPERIAPGTLKQDQRYLARSMRRLTMLVSGFALASAVLVFLLFPRGTGAGILGPLQSVHPVQALTGFSGEVNFQDVARITQSHETVAFVKLWHDDQLIAGTQTLFLRGLTLDTYRKRGRDSDAGWEWTRNAQADSPVKALPNDPLRVPPNSPDRWRQQIALLPTHTDVLFAMPGAFEFRPRESLKVRRSDDGSLQAVSPLNGRIDYEVISTDELGSEDHPANFRNAAPLRMDFSKIYEFARRPEVSGTSEDGKPLADLRVKLGGPSELDEQIAHNIEHYLRTHFTYTLDLSDERRVRDREPLEAFLYDWKKGHCEYFAGAMTLMCQTLGMQARMAIGFECDGSSFNTLNDQYTVRDSDAHAWVEVLTPEGWKTFDPTSSILASESSSSNLVTRIRHVIDYLEYTYANAVIAYDAQSQNSVVAAVESDLATAASQGSNALAELHSSLIDEHPVRFWSASSAILSGLLLLMIAILATALSWFLIERAILRRRAARIGLESLPESEQFRLARQLGFYDELLQLLRRNQIVRPAHRTPLEFSQSLEFLPADAYDEVQRLTELYYRVRYGGADLPAGRQRRLSVALEKLGKRLGGGPAGA